MVFHEQGGGPAYAVQTGRKDGTISRAQDVNLPNPFLTVTQTIAAFSAKKFTPEEMVVLLARLPLSWYFTLCFFFKIDYTKVLANLTQKWTKIFTSN